MQTDFKVRERDSTVVFAKAVDVRLGNIGETIGSSFGEVYRHLAAHGVTPKDPPFVIYYGQPSGDDEPFPIEICAPVDEQVEPPEGWTRIELPAGTFASVVHVGPYDKLGTAYDELQGWIGREGLAIAGPPREVYLSDPATMPSEIRTVVEFPVSESEAAVPALA